MGAIPEEDLQLIEAAAAAIGLKTVRYTVRDNTTIHANNRIWNPLDPNKGDFWDLFKGLAGRILITVETGYTLASIRTEYAVGEPHTWNGMGLEQLPIPFSLTKISNEFDPAQFCRALTNLAANYHHYRSKS